MENILFLHQIQYFCFRIIFLHRFIIHIFFRIIFYTLHFTTSMALLYLTIVTLFQFTTGLYTAQPTWLTSDFVRAGNKNIISTLTGNSVTPTFTFTFSSPLPGVPYLGYGIKAYEGNDYLGQQYFQVYRTNLDATSFRVAVQILGVTNIFTMNVPYIAIDPQFPHHLNSFDNVPVNFSKGLLTNITSASTVLQSYTNVINYTQQTAGMRYRSFLEPLNRNKVILFLTSLFFSGSNEGTSTTLRPINITVTTQIVSTSQYQIYVSLTFSVAITKIHFSILAFDQTDVLSTGKYMLVYQRISLPHTGGFVPVPIQFIDNFIMGLLSFSTNKTQVIIDFQWDFRIIDGNHGAFMPESIGVASSPTGGTQTINNVIYTLFYMKTWLCPNETIETFFDPDINLCSQCPVYQCLDCESLRVCSICNEAANFTLYNQVCGRKCNIYAYGVGLQNNSVDLCQCEQKFLWDSQNNRCVIQCDNLDHNSGSVANVYDRCVCDDKFLWNQTGRDCYVQFDQIRNAIGRSSTIIDECICRDGYGWDPVTISCVFLCNNIQYTDGLKQGTQNECNCIESFAWDFVNLKCVIDCGSILNALSLMDGAIDICQCRSKSLWSIEKKCVIQCSSIHNARGLAPGTTNQCLCNEGFVWNETVQECVIDCSSIQFSVGLLEGSYEDCECKKNYRWKGLLKQCILSCEDIQYTSQSWNLPEDIVCPCLPEFIWNMKLKQCQFNCSTIENSTGEVVQGTTDSCICQQEHIWDQVQMLCKPKQFDYLLASIVGSGVISVAALANFVFIAVKKKIAALSLVGNSSSSAIIIG